MNRADFDKAMQENDVAVLIENTFLARVPDLIASGLSVEEAISAAKEQDDKLCLTLIAPGWQRDAVEELKAKMTKRIYERLRSQPPLPLAINPRWLECEAALGHRPTAHEFIMWWYALRAGGGSDQRPQGES